MSTLRVSLFCKFRLERDGQELKSLNVAKAQELLSYLLLYRDRPHHREALATVLWEDTPETQSKRYFRRALWQLQSSLTVREASPDDNVILVEGDWVQINPQADIWVDTEFFEQSYIRTRGISGQQLEADSVSQLRWAVQLYRGDLLNGWYQPWCLFERERFQQIFLAILDKLMLYCEAAEAYEESIEYGTSALRYDKTREQTYRCLMRLFCLCGDRIGALHQYEKCKAILNEELGIDPSQTTTVLYEQIRTGPFDAHFPSGFDYNGPSSRTQPLLEKVYGELREIRALLLSIDTQVNRQIESVESILEVQS